MNKQNGQRLFFVIAVLAFSCLLLCGGSRLIAAPDEAPAAVLPQASRMNASITCPPSSPETDVQMNAAQEKGDYAESVVCSIDMPEEDRLLQTDANGNVLGHMSYMRAVYHVFALGDGFV